MAGKLITDFFKEDCSEVSKVHTKAAEQMYDEHINDIRSKYQKDISDLTKTVEQKQSEHQLLAQTFELKQMEHQHSTFI